MSARWLLAPAAHQGTRCDPALRGLLWGTGEGYGGSDGQ
jgi:hypothetical protein